MKRILTITLAVLMLPSLKAQVQSYSLAQAQDYALENSYSFRTGSLEVEKSKKILMENIARGLPQINTSANWTKNINLQSFVVSDDQGNLAPLTFGTPYQANGVISGEQLIFDGSYIIAVLGSQVLKQNSINELEKTTIQVREDVAKAYHLTLVAERTKEIIDENLVFITKNYDESAKMYEAGLMEEQDVDQLELIKLNLENQRVYAEKQISIAYMLLKFYMGLEVSQEIELSDQVETLMLFSQDGSSLLNEQFELEDHIDYRSIETREKGQNLNLKNERVALLPKLKFNYIYQHNIFSANANVLSGEMNVDRADNVMQNFGFNISLPIITGGSRVSRIQQAQIEVDQLGINKQQLIDNLKVQYATAKAEYEFALNSYFTQKRNVEISKKIRDISAKKFSEGMISSLEFTQSENQYQDALKSIIDAANNVLDKKVQLEKIIGKYNN